MDGGLDIPFVSARDSHPTPLPDYLVSTYRWAYLTPLSLRVFDNAIIPSAILWGNMARLVRAACREFLPGQRILQAAHAYGNLSASLATTVGPDGRLDVIDIAPIQVEHVRRKLAGFPNARARVADAAAPGGGLYDGVCCFFLLHEIPDEHKHLVTQGLLACVPAGGRVVFIDYHRARWWQPLRLPMNLVFRLLEPFAFGLIGREIRDFAGEQGKGFDWSKETFFGGLYQKVVAVRRWKSAAGR